MGLLAMDGNAPKSIEESFIDWENSAFGFGYGTGEEHTIGALKAFLAAFGRDVGDRHNERAYDYQALELAVTPTVAWLLINTLCRLNIFEYGTSPRYGWLTAEGERLKAFVDARSVEALVLLTCVTEDYNICYPNACNCGPDGYEEGRKCVNPFWK